MKVLITEVNKQLNHYIVKECVNRVIGEGIDRDITKADVTIYRRMDL